MPIPPLFQLLQPRTGPVRSLHRLPLPADEPQTDVVLGQQEFSATAKGELPGRRGGTVSGCGSGLTPDAAAVPALAELLERHATTCWRPGELRFATAEELGAMAFDLRSVPQCSEAERSDAACTVTAPDLREPIFWVDGLDLHTGAPVLLPAVMVFTHLRANRSERFWLQSTSGCAAQTSFAAALCSAISELIERDILSILWLQRMPLPRIEVDRMSEDLRPYWEQYGRSSRHLQYYFFDATSDLGIPTVYGVRRSHLDTPVRTLVSCAAGETLEHALIKAMRDLTVSMHGFRVPREPPASWKEFTTMHHGAALMSRAEAETAFDFLLQTPSSTRLSEHRAARYSSPEAWLKHLLAALRHANLSAYATDLTTVEARALGMLVVRVIVPSLQPLSFHYSARFFANARLYTVPAAMGYRVHQEPDLNAWPQPFF